MSACDDRLGALNALVDGELDAVHADEIERHVRGCAGCEAELALLRVSRAVFEGRREALAFAPPPGLEARVMAAVSAAAEVTPPRRWRWPGEGWLAGGSVAAAAAGLALFAASPASLSAQLADAQARSLQPAHLVDVASAEPGAVGPWFAGKVSFAPPVADLLPAGYRLEGGRLDRIAGRDAAVLVFRRGEHAINLFMWPGQAPPHAHVSRQGGYTLLNWGRRGLSFWAVSDIPPADLVAFHKAYEAATGT